ncbi:MAG: SUMF1/EgtB/PvdO family nonheme iron enzyme [Coleofasciculus sp. G1-WW12-02]
MTFTSIHACKKSIYQKMEKCRMGTLVIIEGIDETRFYRQAHPEFSPVGWHLGHIAFTEAYWILERYAGNKPLFPEYHRLFAADGLPKCDRQKLPSLAEIQDYLDIVRTQVFDYLEIAPLDHQERLWRWLLQHESQHAETIAFVLQLHRLSANDNTLCQTGRTPRSLVLNNPFEPKGDKTPDKGQMIEIPAGEFEMGSDGIDAMDNESPCDRVFLNTYWIDRYPVTCQQYRAFIEAGGYQNHNWWSVEGWKWLQDNPVAYPLYWSDEPFWDNHPVYGVSWYEAEAYANFVGKRLPSEAEWEKAASWDSQKGCRSIYPWGDTEPTSYACNYDNRVGHTTPVNAYPQGQSPSGCYDMLGNVWEWTASWFDGYKGFVSYPYRGYSQAYFDGKHRVLRGGSWTTRPWAMRCSFRNWYYPSVRQILAGFRCAVDG